MKTLSLIQLNIERDKHLDRVLPFLKERQPEVVCLQEVFERDVPLLAEAMGGTAYFVPKMIWEGSVMGICIISRLPLLNMHSDQYAGASELRTFVNGTAEEKHSSMRYILASAEIEKDGTLFKIATTHFTWTPGGEADDFQRADIQSLLATLAPLGDLVFTGDFNAPRGREIWELLATSYKDNVPDVHQSSLDPNLHRAGPLPYVVDGIFSTPVYHVSHVEMICGVSDHCALVADISRD